MEKSLGETLFEFRAKNNLTIKQVAEMVGVSAPTIATWKEGIRSAGRRNSWLNGFVKE